MRRLIDRARVQRYRVAVIVYGLINFESYFIGREIAERLRSQDPSRYLHLETTYKYFHILSAGLSLQSDSPCEDGE